MQIVWTSQHPDYVGVDEKKTWLCAESNGAKLDVSVDDSYDDGLRVWWRVKRPRHKLSVSGFITCEAESELTRAFARAKKLAEAFALCWPEDSN